ncbi:MAG: PAS domain S-box protein, partial [Chloroflexi bacterium]
MSVKTQRKTKIKPVYKIAAPKKARRSAPKPASRSNGKSALGAYEQLHVGIVEASPKGKYIDANQEFCRILGYSKKELLRLSVKDCTHADDFGLDMKLHDQLVRGEIPFYGLEKRYVRKDGGIIWVELTRSLVRDEEGKPLYTVAVVTDISGHKRVERVLRESVESLRFATEAARMFKWELDLQKQLYTFSDNFEQVIGFSSGLLPQTSVETVLSFSPPEDVRIISDSVAKAIENHSDLNSLQYRVIDPANGQTVWLEVNAKIVYDDQGNPQRMFGVAQNITEDKQREEKLRELNRQIKRQHDVFDTTLSNVRDTIYNFDPSGHILYANQTLLDIWGLKQEEAIGKTMADLNYPKEVEQRILEGIQQVLTTKQTVKNETFYTSPLGESAYYENILTPVFAEDGTVEFITGSSRDITARKRAEQVLTEYARQQAALYQLVDQLRHTNSLADVYNSALEAILSALQCDRASILLCDDTDVMRFVAWRGLSYGYRKATEGHSPWTSDEKNPYPVCVNDIRTASLSDSLKTTIQEEGIRALAFIPLVSNGRLIGKFMVYFNTPHECSDAEIELGLMIARQLAFGIDRIQAENALLASEAKLQAELADLKQLQITSSQLIREDNVNVLYEQIITAAIALMRSDMASLQVFHPEKNELQLLAWKGFHPQSAAFWEWVRVDSNSSCALAMNGGERVSVTDVETSDSLAGSE